MAGLVAKNTIHRRVDDEFHEILPGTIFEPQDDEERNELIATNSVYTSLEEKQAFEQAAEGTFRRSKPGVVIRPVPAHALRVEASLANGEQPVVYDAMSSQSQQIASGAEAVKRRARAEKRAAALD